MRLFDGAEEFLTEYHDKFSDIYNNAVSYVTISPELMDHLKANAFLVFGVSIIFWPLLFSIITTAAAMGGWVFWLITSFLFSSLQLVYVVYEFIMISVDLFGLSLMKTYTVLRNRTLMVLGMIFGGRFRSRRKDWQMKLEAAESYEDFLKIHIAAKEAVNNPPTPKKADSAMANGNGTIDGSKAASDRPFVKRSSSFNNMQRLKEGGGNNAISRNRSYVTLKEAEAAEANGTAPAPGGDYNVPKDHEVVTELGDMNTTMLTTTKRRLREARLTAMKNEDKLDAGASLKQLLSGVVKRNHLNVDNFYLDNARSIANSGQYGLSAKSRKLINSYLDEVEKGLDWIADSPIPDDPEDYATMDNNNNNSFTASNNNNDSNNNLDNSSHNSFSFKLKNAHTELNDRITLIRKLRANVGRTALMLSGGGAIAMYHLGTVKALIDANVYDDIKVISGASGGSIAAAMCALKTPDELIKHVCVSTVSTDYMLNGEMKKRNIAWFPPLAEMGKYWLKHKLLVDSAFFRRTCEFYFGDATFEEAFEKTGKHVCITVSASRASGSTAQRLLLNHISTPHVTIASAVAASCALPGVMSPTKLMAKNIEGKLESFEVDGVEWIDGSVQADLPFQRIGTLFNVTNFIVCQVNFHIMPFLNKSHHPGKHTLYWRLFQLFEWDIRNRVLQLSRLGLFPKLFGQDVSKVFKQKYHGDLTLVPRFTTAQTLGMKALANPTVEDMEGFLKYGQMAAWPYLNVIRNMVRFERALDTCLSHLEDRYRDLHPDVDWAARDEIESIASASGSFPASSVTPGRVRFAGSVGQERKAEKLRTKVMTLEEENVKLKEQLQKMEKLLASSLAKEAATADLANDRVSLTEGELWNLVRNSS